MVCAAARAARGFTLLDALLCITMLGLLSAGYTQVLTGMAARAARAQQEQLALDWAHAWLLHGVHHGPGAVPLGATGPGCQGVCAPDGHAWPAAARLAGCTQHTRATPHPLPGLAAHEAWHLRVSVHCAGLGTVVADGLHIRPGPQPYSAAAAAAAAAAARQPPWP